MGQVTKIEWCDHTFNPWIGCSKVSAGCTNCYAEALMDKRWGKVQWGDKGTRQRTSAANWREPIKWNKAAKEAGERRRVFCASLADVFEDRDELIRWRKELFDLIYATPDLDWLLLTKRPENIIPMIGGESGTGAANLPEIWPNIWLGTSVEDQKNADARIPHLLVCPAAVHFLSCEPLLGPIDLRSINLGIGENIDKADGPPQHFTFDSLDGTSPGGSRINWVIIGGESGHSARPCRLDWIFDIVHQCKAAGTACFVKQIGSVPMEIPPGKRAPFEGAGTYWRRLQKDSKGGDPDEWPEALRVREFPILATK
jgi:protein gp37